MNYKIVRVSNVPADTVELLVQLVEGYNDDWNPEDERKLKRTSFWGPGPVPDQPVEILVSPKKYFAFKNDLALLKLKHKVLICATYQFFCNSFIGVELKRAQNFWASGFGFQAQVRLGLDKFGFKPVGLLKIAIRRVVMAKL